MMEKSELAWNLQDYLDHGQEPPRRLELQPETCEGELMSDGEIVDYISDTVKTLMVMGDSGSSSFAAVQGAFFADLKFLVEIGRLGLDEYNELVNEDNYRF